jgi:hypothetical protein
MIQHLEHVVVVADLGSAGRVTRVGRFLGDFVPHLCEIHVDTGVVLNKLLELLQHGDELLFAVLVDMVDGFTEPGMVNAVVGW